MKNSTRLCICILIVLATLCPISCTRQAKMIIFSTALRASLQAFQSQKQVAANAYSSASETREEALSEDRPFTDPKIKAFVEKWRLVEKDVQKLRSTFNEVVGSADYLFAYCEKKRDAIHDSDLRERVETEIEVKKTGFTEASIRANGAIVVLEDAVQHGNDIILALEIINALGEIEDKISKFDELKNLADQKLPDLDGLVNEGFKILDSKLVTKSENNS